MPSSGPSSAPGASAPVVYRIDRADRLVWTNASWRAFAAQNHGDALMALDPPGARLWDMLGADATTVHIYQRLVARVRAGGGEVRFPFRCDAPDRCRLMRMTIRAVGEGIVEFQVDLLADRTRAPVSLLEVGRLRSSEVQVICGWCNRVRLPDGAWMDVDEAIGALGLFDDGYPPTLSHGICERCAVEFTMDSPDNDAAMLQPKVSIGL